MAKGETLLDTGRTLDMMGTDIIIIRHPMSGAPALLSRYVNASVINAGDGMNEHPSQALLDMFTIKEHKGRIEGLKVAIIGDVYHSRVARSNMWGLSKMGAEVVLASPPTLMPLHMDKTGFKVTYDVEEAVRDADAVMCLRIQKERQQAGLFPSVREYFDFFGLDQKKLALAKPDAIVMHPGPMNRGTEISSFIADGRQSVVCNQVQNGVAVRMAMLHLLARRRSE